MWNYGRILLLFFLLAFSCDSKDTNTVLDDIKEEDDDSSEVGFALKQVFSQVSFNQPVDLQSPNDETNRIFVVEKNGRILVFPKDENVASATIFLDLSATLSSRSEQGLLGLAFHPDFVTNGFFYVYYTPTEGKSVVSRFTVSTATGNSADVSSELVLLEIPQPFTNHNGGQLAFGPDGYLYIALGDGGSGGDPRNHGQMTSTLLGSILRIDVNTSSDGLAYGIPPENPFIIESTVRDEIYAYGFRNPWRMSFDTQTARLWVGDVGQNEIEEIDIVVVAGNFGWKAFEGTSCFSGDCATTGIIMPVFEYDHDNGDRSITGGYVYRGEALPSLQGTYIYGDFISGRIWGFTSEGTINTLLIESELSISSFGTDNDQELYICSFDGKIYMLEKI